MAPDSGNAADEALERPMTFADKVKREIKEWAATLAVFIPVFMIFSGLFYEQRVIPSESMVPTLEVTDRVAVSKFAYGYGRYSLPFSMGRYLPLGSGRFFPKTPKHGDVVVFEHPQIARVMIKRVIGLPGDVVQMVDEALYVNGEPVDAEFLRTVRYRPHGRPYVETAHEWRETLGGESYLTHRQVAGTEGDNSPAFRVPAGHMFLMGDNRDNSLDSRFPSDYCPPVNGVIDRSGCALNVSADMASVGFVPLDHLIGRADTVLLSLHQCKLENNEPCKKRIWRGL